MPTIPTVQKVVAKVCSIPADLHKRGDVSVVYLLEESEYATVRDAITVSVIEQYLQTHLRLIDDWSGYSDDKRSDSGWYFDGSRFTIGYFSLESGRSQIQFFPDQARACAEFIKHELESIRENSHLGRVRRALGH